MNNLDALNQHLGIVDQAADLIQASQAAILPKTANMTHYTADGDQKAYHANTDFTQLTTDSNGKINGGYIQHDKYNMQGIHHSSAKVAMGANAKPSTSEMTLFNRFSTGVFRKIQADFSAVQWSESGNISNGQMAVHTMHGETGAQVSTGTLNFENEVLNKGYFTHFDVNNAGTVIGNTDVDYTGLSLLGNRIVGGALQVSHRKSDGISQSQSQVALDNLGRISAVQTVNYQKEQVKTQVKTTFANLAYTLENHIQSGDVICEVSDPVNMPLNSTTITFEHEVPRQAVTRIYKPTLGADGKQEQVVSSLVHVDYGSALFNNHLKVVNSAVLVSVYDANNQMISQSTVTYDGNGQVTARQKGNLLSTVNTTVVPPSPTMPPAPTPPATINTPATTGNSRQETQSVKRPDGTLESTTVTTYVDDKAVSAVITRYQKDGTTINKTLQMNFNMLASDATKLGNISLKSLAGASLAEFDGLINF